MQRDGSAIRRDVTRALPSRTRPVEWARLGPWLKAYYDGLRARGKLPKLAIRMLLVAVYSVAKSRKSFVPRITECTA
jgi:hypothetical protein